MKDEGMLKDAFNKLPSTILERFLRRIKAPFTR